jgi:hypothetical protein
MNEEEHELGKAIFGVTVLSMIPIFWMICLLFS